MNGRPIRILVVTVDYPPIEGGIGTLTREVSRELSRKGFDVTVLAPGFPGMDASDQEEPARIVRFGGYRLGWLRIFPVLVRARALVPHYDLILAMNITYGGTAGLLARSLFGVPYVTFAYGYEFLKFKRFRPAAAYLRYLYAQSRGVIAISGFTRDRLIDFGVSAGKIAAILPGANPAPPVNAQAVERIRQLYPIEGKRVILSVGRLVPRKGHLALLRAMPEVIKRVPNAHLIVVGQGPEISPCSRAAQRMGVRDHVTFAGALDDGGVQALYSLCDVFALPVREDAHGQIEGFGLVFSEAHAHGKPVVAGKSGGVAEAVLHDETGILVNPDNPDEIAGAIASILLDETMARRLGRNGRARIERELNWQAFTRQMLFALGIAP